MKPTNKIISERKEVIKILQNNIDVFRKYKVKRIGLFGS